MKRSPSALSAPVLIFAAALALPRVASAAAFDCLITPDDTVELGSPIAGVMAEIAVDRGDRVTEGQMLARLSDSAERAALELARARAEFGERKVARNEDLYRDELISIHEKDEMETEALIAALEVREAEARLDLRTLASPLAGVVVERHVSAGEFVGDTPILTLAKVHPLQVEVVVPVAHWGSIREGMRATVEPQAPVGGSYEARVTVVDPVVDAASGTFGVRLELPNPERKLPAGLRCTVAFLVGQG